MVSIVRSRDVRSNIKEWGFEKGVVMTLEGLCEVMTGHRQTMRELAQMLAQCIDEVAQMVEVGDGMQRQLKEVQRREQQYTDIDHVPDGNE